MVPFLCEFHSIDAEKSLLCSIGHLEWMRLLGLSFILNFWATLLSHIITFLFGGSVLSMIVHRLATSNSIMRSQYSVVHLSAWAQECSCCVNIIKLQHRSINMVLWMRHELSTTTYLRCISWSSGHMLVLHFGRLSGHRQISRDAI